MDHVRIGLVGLGTVGSGVYKVLRDNRDLITKKVGRELRIEKILVINRYQEEILHLKPQALTGILKLLTASQHDHPQFRY